MSSPHCPIREPNHDVMVIARSHEYACKHLLPKKAIASHVREKYIIGPIIAEKGKDKPCIHAQDVQISSFPIKK